MKISFDLNIDSQVDVITNSSSVIYIDSSEDKIENIKEICKKFEKSLGLWEGFLESFRYYANRIYITSHLGIEDNRKIAKEIKEMFGTNVVLEQQDEEDIEEI